MIGEKGKRILTNERADGYVLESRNRAGPNAINPKLGWQ